MSVKENKIVFSIDDDTMEFLRIDSEHFGIPISEIAKFHMLANINILIREMHREKLREIDKEE